MQESGLGLAGLPVRGDDARMRSLRPALLLSALVATAAFLFPGSAAASHDDEHPASGEWEMQFPDSDPGVRAGRAKTGKLRLRAVSRAVGEQEQTAFKWGSFVHECGSNAQDYYVGSFERDTDSGPIVGCIHPVSGIFHGVFRSKQYGVEGAIEGVLGGPVAAGVFPARPSDVLGTSFRRHFPGDGTSAAASCPAPRRTSARTRSVPASQASPPKRIEDTAEYKTFLGICDADTVPTRRGWGPWIQARARDFIQRASSFPGASSEGMLEGEDSFGLHSARLVHVPPSDYFTIFGTDQLPQDLWRAGNVFALATAAVYEGALRKAIVSGKGGLYPADVVELALKVTKGSYPLAVLTAHNLFKNITKLGRDEIKRAQQAPREFRTSPIRFLRPLREHNEVVEKLASLRWKPSADMDKMGPWYHIFAVMSGGALNWSAGSARELVDLEHGAKKINFFQGEGGHDVIKHQIDHCFAFAAGERPLAKLSRFWDHSLFADLFATITVDNCLLGPIKYATD
jgi:hypothetical protein